MPKEASKIISRKRPLVVLWSRPDNDPASQAYHAISEESNIRSWDLLDLRFTLGAVPEGRHISGAIISCLPSDPVVKRLHARGVPIVRMGHLPHPKDHLFPAVLPNLDIGARLVSEYFKERGFHHVGFVRQNPWGLGEQFYIKTRDAIASMGMECHQLAVPGADGAPALIRQKARMKMIGEWMLKQPGPLGIFASYDRWAAMICAVCDKVGLRVPEDVALLGSGNSSLDCDMAPVKLSSIDWARDEIGSVAVTTLSNLMDGKKVSNTRLLVSPKGIVTRRSTDMLAVADRDVATALRYMWDHLDANLSVNDVVAAVGCNRRRLERSFSRHLGRGINAELRRKRLERVCELLRSTDMKIADIAALAGFGSADHMHLAFRQTYGQTPRQYRAAAIPS